MNYFNRFLTPQKVKSDFLHAGVVVPRFGTIARIGPLIRLRDLVRGKYHRNTAMFLLVNSERKKAKMILCEPSETWSRTREAAAQLALLRREHCVPEVLFVDERHLILEFIPGTVLDPKTIDRYKASRLGTFVATCQPILEMRPLPTADLQANLDCLVDSGYLDRRIEEDSTGYVFDEDRIRDANDAPANDAPVAVVFGDPALKNFVIGASDEITYVDAFGIMRNHLGTAFMKQSFGLPAAVRRAFMESFSRISSHAPHIDEHFSLYCRAYLADRAVARLHDVENTDLSRLTRRRLRHRRRVFAATMAQLKQCLDLPEDTAAHRRWMLEQPGP